MIEHLKHLSKKILSTTRLKTFSLYLYGSYLDKGTEARDVDLVLVSPEVSNPSLFTFFAHIGHRTLPVNVYLVPENYFRADVERLAYGGFYAHKFAFAFRLLAKEGKVLDPGREFWLFQLRRYRTRLTEPVKPEVLMRLVHQEIYMFNPFIGRSMTKFLSSSKVYEALIAFLADRVIVESSNVVVPFKSSVWQGECEKVMYRFWAEYRRHKQNTSMWKDVVREKMIISLRESDYPLLERYIHLEIKVPIMEDGEREKI